MAKVALLYERVVYVATGSGIGPILGQILAARVPARLVWSTRDPRATYGDALVDEVEAAQPDALVWDTTRARQARPRRARAPGVPRLRRRGRLRRQQPADDPAPRARAGAARHPGLRADLGLLARRRADRPRGRLRGGLRRHPPRAAPSAAAHAATPAAALTQPGPPGPGVQLSGRSTPALPVRSRSSTTVPRSRSALRESPMSAPAAGCGLPTASARPSVTKSFVATVALQLVGEGKLSLSDSVERRLPGILPYGETVSLRQPARPTPAACRICRRRSPRSSSTGATSPARGPRASSSPPSPASSRTSRPGPRGTTPTRTTCSSGS